MKPAQKLPELKTPPIVEAVVDIAVRATESFTEDATLGIVREHLPDYPDIRHADSLKEFAPSNGTEVSSTRGPRGDWKGVLMKSSDGFNTIQFVTDGYFFSRVHPYYGWDAFVEEALRGWQVYQGISRPPAIDRVALRIIYRIDLVEGHAADLGKYLVPDPQVPLGPEFSNVGLFHSERYFHRETRLLVDLNKTVMPAPGPESDNPGLLIDIEASTTEGAELDDRSIEEQLARMHRLIEQVLFTATNKQVLARYH